MIRDVFPEAMIVRPADIFGWQDRFIHHYCYSCMCEILLDYSISMSTIFFYLVRRNILQQMCLYRKGDHTYKGPVHVNINHHNLLNKVNGN